VRSVMSIPSRLVHMSESEETFFRTAVVNPVATDIADIRDVHR